MVKIIYISFTQFSPLQHFGLRHLELGCRDLWLRAQGSGLRACQSHSGLLFLREGELQMWQLPLKVKFPQPWQRSRWMWRARFKMCCSLFWMAGWLLAFWLWQRRMSKLISWNLLCIDCYFKHILIFKTCSTCFWFEILCGCSLYKEHAVSSSVLPFPLRCCQLLYLVLCWVWRPHCLILSEGQCAWRCYFRQVLPHPGL